MSELKQKQIDSLVGEMVNMIKAELPEERHDELFLLEETFVRPLAEAFLDGREKEAMDSLLGELKMEFGGLKDDREESIDLIGGNRDYCVLHSLRDVLENFFASKRSERENEAVIINFPKR